ncbi:hypothetical protein BSBH6_04087 [Bacillus subtilis]|nr:hypothetical protein BSBH6_04087 [Bacillus subtilis]RPK20296.1 hypothetical protein BH5_04088 [Bacillus subtilis]
MLWFWERKFQTVLLKPKKELDDDDFVFYLQNLHEFGFLD